MWKEGGYYQIGFNAGFLGRPKKLPECQHDRDQYRTGYRHGSASARRKQNLVRVLQAVLKGNRALEVRGLRGMMIRSKQAYLSTQQRPAFTKVCVNWCRLRK